MVNLNYIKGRNFEYRVRNDLRKNGFYVIRQAKSAFPDLFAIRISPNTGKICIVECKVNREDFTKEELLEMQRMWADYEFHPFLAFREKRKIIYVDLLNGDELKKI